MNNLKFILDAFKESRGLIIRYLDDALEKKLISKRDRDIVYYRNIDFNSLNNTGKKFSLTTERIRQIEARVFEVLRYINEDTK